MYMQRVRLLEMGPVQQVLDRIDSGSTIMTTALDVCGDLPDSECDLVSDDDYDEGGEVESIPDEIDYAGNLYDKFEIALAVQEQQSEADDDLLLNESDPLIFEGMRHLYQARSRPAHLLHEIYFLHHPLHYLRHQILFDFIHDLLHHLRPMLFLWFPLRSYLLHDPHKTSTLRKVLNPQWYRISDATLQPPYVNHPAFLAVSALWVKSSQSSTTQRGGCKGP